MAGKVGKEVYRTRAWRAVRLAVLRRARWKCQRCGKHGRLEVHHKRALADGGDPYDLGNLEAVCRGCHFEETGKRNRKPADPGWTAYVETLVKGKDHEEIAETRHRDFGEAAGAP